MNILNQDTNWDGDNTPFETACTPSQFGTAAQSLHPEATQHEILAVLARSLSIKSYLEVGVRDGHSLVPVIEAARGTLERVALADNWWHDAGGSGRGNHIHIDQLLTDFAYTGDRIWLDGRSQETLPHLDGKFDLVHIDGSHDYEDALEDLRNGWALCSGAMVVHDIGLVPEVNRAVDTFEDDPLGATITIHTGGHGTEVFWR